MDYLVIEGSKRLQGEIEVSGAKNAALPILFGSLLSDQKLTIENVPNLADIITTLKILRQMGVECVHDRTNRRVELQAANITDPVASYDLVRTMRASILVLGPLLARFGRARVSLPGGCSIGARPVNLHLMALEKMGAEISIESGYVEAECTRLRGATIAFPTVSVGATENTMMAAAIAEGTTVLKNAAREPEIVDLANFLNSMGAKIKGAGTATVEIDGVPTLRSTRHRVVSDRIEAGTYLIAAAITGGNAVIKNVTENLLGAFAEKLRQTGCAVRTEGDTIAIAAADKLLPVDFSTEPFPGFATDMQAQFMSLLCLAHGRSTITETIFENRFMHVGELLRLGAQITISGNKAVVDGLGGTGKLLSGASVMATDLRASACLVLAGLAAKGQTTVRRIYHLDRGYEHMEEKLRKLGASIERRSE